MVIEDGVKGVIWVGSRGSAASTCSRRIRGWVCRARTVMRGRRGRVVGRVLRSRRRCGVVAVVVIGGHDEAVSFRRELLGCSLRYSQVPTKSDWRATECRQDGPPGRRMEVVESVQRARGSWISFVQDKFRRQPVRSGSCSCDDLGCFAFQGPSSSVTKWCPRRFGESDGNGGRKSRNDCAGWLFLCNVQSNEKAERVKCWMVVVVGGGRPAPLNLKHEIRGVE